MANMSKLLLRIVMVLVVLLFGSGVWIQHLYSVITEVNMSTVANQINLVDDALSNIKSYNQTSESDDIAQLQVRFRVIQAEAQRLNYLRQLNMLYNDGLPPLYPDEYLFELQRRGDNSQLNRYLSLVQTKLEVYKRARESSNAREYEQNDQIFVQFWSDLVTSTKAFESKR